ncbi:Ptr3p ASCRUDRAFT_77817 [Ascoidea rubescens DSM 1968]|uniref:Uncharacterized protein n=1 Tax=Ascoidea rubescens DSM 1968 TaxID=1344418 RepID=A0A1D2VA58_9ASCO|nr:hypothetical protein ASCRUDRAFT_77817 [Ascoidea rubescens DSM 1968]ODV58566.1 hypothetical protein ASCRUDRAFT_77817 [Ascoidea rubescens DSM 1968]
MSCFSAPDVFLKALDRLEKLLYLPALLDPSSAAIVYAAVSDPVILSCGCIFSSALFLSSSSSTCPICLLSPVFKVSNLNILRKLAKYISNYKALFRKNSSSLAPLSGTSHTRNIPLQSSKGLDHNQTFLQSSSNTTTIKKNNKKKFVKFEYTEKRHIDAIKEIKKKHEDEKFLNRSLFDPVLRDNCENKSLLAIFDNVAKKIKNNSDQNIDKNNDNTIRNANIIITSSDPNTISNNISNISNNISNISNDNNITIPIIDQPIKLLSNTPVSSSPQQISDIYFKLNPSYLNPNLTKNNISINNNLFPPKTVSFTNQPPSSLPFASFSSNNNIDRNISSSNTNPPIISSVDPLDTSQYIPPSSSSPIPIPIQNTIQNTIPNSNSNSKISSLSKSLSNVIRKSASVSSLLKKKSSFSNLNSISNASSNLIQISNQTLNQNLNQNSISDSQSTSSNILSLNNNKNNNIIMINNNNNSNDSIKFGSSYNSFPPKSNLSYISSPSNYPSVTIPLANYEARFSTNFPIYRKKIQHPFKLNRKNYLKRPDFIGTALSPLATKFALIDEKRWFVYKISSNSNKKPSLLCCGNKDGDYGTNFENLIQYNPYNNNLSPNIDLLINGNSQAKEFIKKGIWEFSFVALSENLLVIYGKRLIRIYDVSNNGMPIYTRYGISVRCMDISPIENLIALGLTKKDKATDGEGSIILLIQLSFQPNFNFNLNNADSNINNINNENNNDGNNSFILDSNIPTISTYRNSNSSSAASNPSSPTISSFFNNIVNTNNTTTNNNNINASKLIYSQGSSVKSPGEISTNDGNSSNARSFNFTLTSVDHKLITLGYNDPINVVKFSKDGVYLSCATILESRFMVINVRNPADVRLVMKSKKDIDTAYESEGITDLEFVDADNNLMVVSSVAFKTPPVLIETLIPKSNPDLLFTQPRLKARINNIGSAIHRCTASPRGYALSLLNKKGDVFIVDISGAQEIRRILMVDNVMSATKKSESASLGFSADGYKLFIIDRRGTLYIDDFIAGTPQSPDVTKCKSVL